MDKEIKNISYYIFAEPVKQKLVSTSRWRFRLHVKHARNVKHARVCSLLRALLMFVSSPQNKLLFLYNLEA